jgi:serine/threonine protein kinase
MAASGSEKYALLDQLADEFAERYRRGERPALQEYLDKYPALADDIRELFPAMVEIEQVKEDRSAAEEAPPSGPLPPLEQVGDFRIIREVGKGGMGVVYEAEQISLGRRVALKVLPQQLLLEAKQRRRFAREAKALAKLHHTNIVPVFGVGEHNGMPPSCRWQSRSAGDRFPSWGLIPCLRLIPPAWAEVWIRLAALLLVHQVCRTSAR